MIDFFLTIIVASFGGFIGIKLKLPAGALFGAMCSVALFNTISNKGNFPQQLNIILQIAIGASIGLNFNKDSLNQMKSIFLAGLILVIGLIILSTILGFLIHKITGLDLVTCLFGASPGGLSNIVLLSEIYGAQAHIVGILHTLRLLSVVIFTPLIISLIDKFIK